MGGYFSTRWGWHRTKPGTDPLLFIDIRYLARHGYLDAPAGKIYARSLSWSSRGKPSGWIMVHVTGADDGMPWDIELVYQVRTYDHEPWTPVRETIDLDYTDCHYGGQRPWFVCPGCGTRKAVLRSVGGRFRCNACHGIAYSSTRESAHDRALRRAHEVRRKLGEGPGPVWHRPPKPKGMHWKTYWRLCQTFDRTDEVVEAGLIDMERRVSKLLNRR